MFYQPPDEESDAPKMPDKEGMEDGEESMAQTGMINSSVFGGKMPKPGDRCTFEVVHCSEDECEIKYLSSEGGEEPESSGDRAAGRMGRMAKYAQGRE